MHEPFAVQEVHCFCYLEEDIQTLVVLPLLREAALGHPVLQVLFSTELHLDVQQHLHTRARLHFKNPPNVSKPQQDQ